MTDQWIAEYGGMELGTFTSPDEAEQAMRLHEYSAVSEGLCPMHRGPLAADGLCVPCLRRWYVKVEPEPEVGWYAAYNLRGFE